MHIPFRTKLLLECLGWLITALIVAMVMFPIWSGFAMPYPFAVENTVFVLLVVTYLRYMLLLRYTWLADPLWAKITVLFLTPELLLWAIFSVNKFQRFYDEQGSDTLLPLMKPASVEAQMQTLFYIKNEMMFFGIASIVLIAAMFPFMIAAIWRKYNRGSV